MDCLNLAPNKLLFATKCIIASRLQPGQALSKSVSAGDMFRLFLMLPKNFP